ncbi:hypothetical protein [Streptomyces sp. NPDC001889]
MSGATTARRLRWLVPVLLAVAAGALLLFREDGGGDGGTATRPPPSSSPPSPAPCTGVNLDGVGPTVAGADRAGVLKFWRGVIGPAYRAACAEDYGRLARLLEFKGSPEYFGTTVCSGCTSSEIVAMWREEFGFRGTDLARVLETRPVQSQGGLMFRRGDAVAWFARGTYGTPGQWTGFHPRCAMEPDCSRYATAAP